MLEFDGVLEDFVSGGLLLEVLDKDVGKMDDPLGNVTVPLDLLRSVASKDFAELLSSRKGNIAFTVSWTPLPPGAEPIQSDLIVRRGERGLLELTLTRGVDLMAMDKSGASDPYVVIFCGSQSKTSKVAIQTLNPEFNETIVFEGILGDFVAERVRLQLYDKDRNKMDDNLGELTVSLDLLLTRHKVRHITHPPIRRDHTAIT